MPSDDVDGRARHISADGWRRDELDDPTEAENTETQHDEATNKRNGRRDLRTLPHIGVVPVNVGNDLGDSERHDGDRTDRDIFRRCEELLGSQDKYNSPSCWCGK